MDSQGKTYFKVFENVTEASLSEHHSLHKMLNLVGYNQAVVEFGCATGYFSQVLRQRGCHVTGVEVDMQAAEVARRVCNRVIVADLDFVPVTRVLPAGGFDVALFGDVLEHLREPWRVLADTRQLLKPGGYVVASVPNIAHGAVRLALLQGRFEYVPEGILDNTHLRFFTRDSLLALFRQAGYTAEIRDRVTFPIFSDCPLVPIVHREDFPPELVGQVEQSEEAQTLQFILRAEPIH